MKQEENILNLLFYKPESMISGINNRIQIMQMLCFFAKEILSSLKAYSKREYSKFDAQVGENLCQVRACYLIYLIKSNPMDLQEVELNKTAQALNCFIKQIGLVIKKYSNSLKACNKDTIAKYKSGRTIQSVLRQENLTISLTENHINLAMLYFLARYSCYDEYKIPFRTDFPKIQLDLDCSKHAAKRTVHHLQHKVSVLSVAFTSKLSKKYLDQKTFSALVRVADENRVVFPCFKGMKILLNYLLQVQIYIFFVLGPECGKLGCKIIKLYKSQFSEFAEVSFDEVVDQADIPCIVIEGIYDGSENLQYIEKKLNGLGIQEVVLLNMAAHAQYTGTKLSSYATNPYIDLVDKHSVKALKEELMYYLHKSELCGYSRSNPSSCLIKHIFCDQLLTQLAKHNINEYLASKISKNTGGRKIQVYT